MNSIYDIQQLLKRFGTFIYTSDRIGDLDLMEMEIDELFQIRFIDVKDYNTSKILLKKERTRLMNQRGANRE